MKKEKQEAFGESIDLRQLPHFILRNNVDLIGSVNLILNCKIITL
jgi:hypothetical protein